MKLSMKSNINMFQTENSWYALQQNLDHKVNHAVTHDSADIVSTPALLKNINHFFVGSCHCKGPFQWELTKEISHAHPSSTNEGLTHLMHAIIVAIYYETNQLKKRWNRSAIFTFRPIATKPAPISYLTTSK